MKRLALLMIAVLCAASAAALDTRYVKVNSPDDIAALKAIPEWRRGVATNELTVSVCIGSLDFGRFCVYPLARDLTFDGEGRLVKASKIWIMDGLVADNLPRITLDSIPKHFFPTEEGRKALKEKERNALKEIQEQLRAQREAREAEAIRQERSRRTPAQPTPPRQSEKPCDDGR